MKIAIFRPKSKEKESRKLLNSLGFEVLSDPLLEFIPTENKPLETADYFIFTSTTGIEILYELNIDFTPFRSGKVCAIGPKTKDALEEINIDVDIVPENYSSRGIVETLKDRIKEKKVEIARSNHGSRELLDGLNNAGGFIHETVLYKIEKPELGGKKTIDALLNNELYAVLFTSSLMVEYFFEASGQYGEKDKVLDSLSDCIIGCIGKRTKETAESFGLTVDYIPENETFEDLVDPLVSSNST